MSMNSILDVLNIEEKRADDIVDKCYEIVVRRSNDEGFEGIFDEVQKIPKSNPERIFVGFIMGEMTQLSKDTAEDLGKRLLAHQNMVKKARDDLSPEIQ